MGLHRLTLFKSQICAIFLKVKSFALEVILLICFDYFEQIVLSCFKMMHQSVENIQSSDWKYVLAKYSFEISFEIYEKYR